MSIQSKKGKPTRDDPRSPLLPKPGEKRITNTKDLRARIASMPSKVQGHMVAHMGNRHTFIIPKSDGAFPEGVIACVRDRKGLLGYYKDGASIRIDAECLADVKDGDAEAAAEADANAKRRKAEAEEAEARKREAQRKAQEAEARKREAQRKAQEAEAKAKADAAKKADAEAKKGDKPTAPPKK